MSVKQFDTPADPIAALQALGDGDINAIDWVVDGKDLRIQQVYRFLSGQRLTAHATWGDTDVVIKCFYGDRHQVYFERETRGLEALETAGVDTVACLFSAQHEQGHLHLMVLSYLEDSITLKQALSQPENSASLSLWLNQAAALFVRLHQANLTQPDPHLENFLISHGQLHMIDAGQIQVSDAPITQSNAMDNLALFFAQLPVRFDAVAMTAVHDYWKNSRNEDEVFVEDDWANRLLLQRRWREKRFIEKKVFRNCTAYVKDVGGGYFRMFDRAYLESEVISVLSQPNQVFEGKAVQTAVAVEHQTIKTQGQAFRLTRFPAAGLFNRMRWSDAAMAWRNAQLLILLGIPTLKPIGFAEHRFGPFRGESYFLMEYDEVQTLSDVLQQTYSESQLMVLFRQVIDLIQALRRVELVHGNLTTESIAVQNGTCYLIQLENLRRAQHTETGPNAVGPDHQKLFEDVERFSDSDELIRNLFQVSTRG